MSILVIIPNDGLRERARELLGPGRSLRARDCEQGLVLAEQNAISDAILWSPPGLDREVLGTIIRLRRLRRDVRIFVVTPERVKAGNLGYIEALQVDGYGLETEIGRIIEDVDGVPMIVERDQTPPTAAGGSSGACH